MSGMKLAWDLLGYGIVSHLVPFITVWAHTIKRRVKHLTRNDIKVMEHLSHLFVDDVGDAVSSTPFYSLFLAGAAWWTFVREFLLGTARLASVGVTMRNIFRLLSAWASYKCDVLARYEKQNHPRLLITSATAKVSEMWVAHTLNHLEHGNLRGSLWSDC